MFDKEIIEAAKCCVNEDEEICRICQFSEEGGCPVRFAQAILNEITIQKKILPEYFSAVKNGTKKFEIRKDEDNIQIGDMVCLNEFDGGGYTGRKITIEVSYVLRSVPEYGLQDGYCIFGWK